MANKNEQKHKRDQVFSDNSMNSNETGLIHGLINAETRSNTGQAFYDSNYETTTVANRKVHAESLEEAEDKSAPLNEPISMEGSLDDKLYENTWSITKALQKATE